MKMFNGIGITDIIIFPVRNRAENSKILAFARVVLNDQLLISGLRVIEGKNGLTVTFPTEYDKTQNKRFDMCIPTTHELRSYLIEEVLEQYALTIPANPLESPIKEVE